MHMINIPPCSKTKGLLVCLFFGGFSSHSKILHSYGDVTSTGEGLHILGLLGLNDLSLSRLVIVFEHLIFRTQGTCSNRLRHRRSKTVGPWPKFFIGLNFSFDSHGPLICISN